MQADVDAFQRFMAGFMGKHPEWFGLSGVERASGEREERQEVAPAFVVAPVEKVEVKAELWDAEDGWEDLAEEVWDDEEAQAEEAAAVLSDNDF